LPKDLLPVAIFPHGLHIARRDRADYALNKKAVYGVLWLRL
jgi:hypothetical protein